MKKIFFLFIFFFCFSINASNKFSVKFDKCIDGDTARFFINGESRTVRFLSINAPEIAHDDIKEEFYGVESSEYACKLLSRASSIKLQYDPKSDKVDKYDRVLAWVYVDGELLQKELVSKGYAEVKYVYDDYLYSNELKELENISKEKKLGMWGNVSNKKESNTPSIHDLIYYSIAAIILLFITLIKKLFSKK
ncbi:MAG: thermonuclease family protein [Bacilli bacterium]